jgi:hypothetical protein
MSGDDERLQILEMIANGQISAAQGVELLNALGEDETGKVQLDSPPATAFPHPSPFLAEGSETAGQKSPEDSFSSPAEPLYPQEVLPPPSLPPGSEKWRSWWWVPLGIGISGTIFGSLLLLWAYQSTGISFWFACAWLPFLAAVSLVALAWASRSMRWLHLRVQQAGGRRQERIAISFPLPLGPAAWIVRMIKQWLPENLAHLDAALLALQGASSDAPLYIEVDEGQDKERVEIYIG